ncbi:MAG TPA: hypothetical protein VH062_21055 [Polyangiaceae bacterium]|nr:hypothetical protein [Polyangiaceae bacterium]
MLVAILVNAGCTSAADAFSSDVHDGATPLGVMSFLDAGSGAATDCDRGTFGVASDASVTPLHGSATVELDVSSANEIIRLETTLGVPGEPSPRGTSFVWPGLQPLGAGPPIGDGVLQTVLTWGATCAPEAPLDPYASWWVSPEYVNPGLDAGPLAGCRGGGGQSVGAGEALHVVLERGGTTWSERVTDQQSGRSSIFAVDLGGQPQRRALFAIEQRDGATPLVASFGETRITFLGPEPVACQPAARGERDVFSVPRSSRDGRTCCIDRIELTAAGAL